MQPRKGPLYFLIYWEVIFLSKKKAEISHPNPDHVEKPIPSRIYPAIDNDLARDNIENNIPAADLEDL